MRHQLLPSGRVHYLPMHDYRGDGTAISLVNGKETRLQARKKVVDATFAETQVPSRTAPSFSVDPRVDLIPSNGLVNLERVSHCFVVIGAGKTAIDTVTWLLENGADPDRLTWSRPRDAWLLNRRTIQPNYEFFDETYGWLAAKFINCSADGIPRRRPHPIVQPGRRVPQYVRMCSPTFSGALVAKVETLLDNDNEKNVLTKPAPIPDMPADWIEIELN